MTIRHVLASSVALAALFGVAGAQAQQQQGQQQGQQQQGQQQAQATAQLQDADGNSVGQVELSQIPNGAHLLATLRDLPSGTHAIHIHETGACEPPDFESAGGHFNPTDANHGWMDPGGPHPGDLPNIHVPDSGMLTVEYFNMLITMDDGPNTVFDDDGSAVVIHEGTDDYTSDPAGQAGSRIACGVIER